MSVAANGRHQNADMVVIGYCVHCRARRQMNDAIEVCNRRGRPDLKGLCSICGKSIYRLGGWDSVAIAHEAARQDLVHPVSVRQEAAQPEVTYQEATNLLVIQVRGNEGEE